MRFVADGPVIPDHLLEVRDDGQVVFLCGAGVSIPAGMPSFIQLTDDVLGHFRAPEDLQASQMFAQWNSGADSVGAGVPLDRIFNSIQEAFGRDQVNAAVAKFLEIPGGAAMSKEHSIVARLSTDAEGNPQIVTTNFDLLFEHPGVIKSPYQIFEPPTFPDLRHNQPVSGLTYLHGRLRTDDTRPHDYVLGSADFGRAYLAEGWATGFVRLLLERYTVVLLGYQADDPPVLYLLQGLNSTSMPASGRLYAFDRGAPEVVEAKWRNRGVTPIAYQGENNNHSRLWTSLEAWANRADDPDTWRSRVIDLACEGPRALQAHERGQVAHVVRTNLGAREFAEAEPAPPAEWLCVLDNGCRLADVGTGHGTDSEFIPRDHYALDDDPVEPPRDRTWRGGNLIAWHPGDECPTSEFCLSGTTLQGLETLPPRLLHLCRWIADNAFDPVVTWWAAKQHRLHPRLASMISRRLESEDEIPATGRLVWDLIFEQHERGGRDFFNMRWVAMRRRIEREGWTRSTLRALERCIEPAIAIGNVTGNARVKPPLAPWPQISLNDIADFRVEVPDLDGMPLEVPDKVVGAVFSMASRNLIRGLERREEIGRSWSPRVTLYRDTGDTSDIGEHYRSPAGEFVFWVAELMTRAAHLDPGRVAATIALWPSDERTVLNKLRLYAWNLPAVFSGEQVAAGLMALDQDSFWKLDDQREFLFLIRGRWDEIPDQEKVRLLERLFAGRDAYPGEDSEDYPDSRDIEVVSRLRWMERNGCVFPEGMPGRIAEVQDRLPEWNDAWAQNAARNLEGQVCTVEIVTDPSVFDGVPVPQIVETALKHSSRQFAGFKDYRPFDGLVRDDPEKSLAALEAVAEMDEYPSELWRALIQQWPEAAPHQATRQLCERLRKLPREVVLKNRHDISFWIRDRLPTVAESDEVLAFETLDHLLCRISAGGPGATRSGFGVISIGVERSRRTLEHAINAPIGRLTRALLTFLDARQLSQGHGMPDSFATRLERLLSTPGEGPDHAVCLLSKRLSRLHDIAPDWVQTHMLPWFTLDNPASEPAWNGLLSGAQIVGPELFDTIKVPFLGLFPRMYDWHWDDDMYRRAHHWLVKSAIRHRQDPRYTSSDEAAAAIRRLSDKGRSDVIHCLGRVGRGNDDGWTGLVIPFICDAWPREVQFQTEQTTASFLSLFMKPGDAFPLILEAVRDYLCPVRQEHSSFYLFDRADTDDEDSITPRFPKETLELMDLVVAADPGEMPHNMGEILALISETCPALEHDPRFVRLRKRLAAR